MNIVVYGRTQIASDIVDTLQFAGHDCRRITDKYFDPGFLEKCDTVVIVECPQAMEIKDAYNTKGIRVFTLDHQPPELPGYPVAAFTNFNYGDYTLWDFLEHQSPDAYQNPDYIKLICSFYPTDIAVIEPKPRRGPMPKLLDVFHSETFTETDRVWIVGGGPSLKGFDWNLLEGEVVIGVNRAFEQPHVGICATMDPLFERLSHNGDLGQDVREKWKDYRGVKLYASVYDSNPRCDHVVIAKREKDDDILPPTVHSIGKASNSGYAAVKLAWAMGAKTINCLGFDMAGENGVQTWFHSGYPEVYADGIYNEYREQMQAAREAMEADGVALTIFGDTALKGFKTRPLGDVAAVVKKKPQRPTVAAFYTRDTAYKAEAEDMARSAVAFGLDVVLVDTDNLGDWKANTDQKPAAIERALRGVDGPIAFVDADARFRAYPKLFDEFCAGPAEIGLSYFDWDAFPDDPRKGRELSSAVILLKPTSRVYALLSKWARATTTSGDMWEQRVLQDLIAKDQKKKRDRLKVMEIPMRYNQIFDHMAGLGKPVIEQMQASRRLKAVV
jgi:hypothetical protein